MERKKSETDKLKEQKVTYDMYVEMPEDGARHEIIDGALEMMSPGPSTVHQSVSGELEFLLKQSCKTNYKIFDAPLDVILSETTVLQPDILMIHRSRLHIVTLRGIEGPPDLVIEILSPGSRSRDKVLKMKSYAEHGVPEYWVVDTEARTLEQYRLMDQVNVYMLHQLFEAEDSVYSDKIPCVQFSVKSIFTELSDH